MTVTGAATIGAAAFVSLRLAQERDGVGAVRGEGTGAATGAKARAKILEPKTQAGARDHRKRAPNSVECPLRHSLYAIFAQNDGP